MFADDTGRRSLYLKQGAVTRLGVCFILYFGRRVGVLQHCMGEACLSCPGGTQCGLLNRKHTSREDLLG